MTSAKLESFYQMAIEIESEYSNCLEYFSEEETKEQRYFFDKQLLNLFKQPLNNADDTPDRLLSN